MNKALGLHGRPVHHNAFKSEIGRIVVTARKRLILRDNARLGVRIRMGIQYPHPYRPA
jgi:hypothetical protein